METKQKIEYLLHKLDIENEYVPTNRIKKPLVEINNLSINFKRSNKLFEAVKNANLEIYEGDILGLVGESGSGKTTLGRSIMSLVDHATGYIKLDGEQVPQTRIASVSEKNKWVYEKAQMIFQDPTSSLNRQEKVYKIVTEGLINFDSIKEECNKQNEELQIKISELEEKIESLTNKEKAVEAIKEDFYKKELASLLRTSNSKELTNYLKKLVKLHELKDELEKTTDDRERIIEESKKLLEIEKLKVKSEKINKKEALAEDTKFFKEFSKINKEQHKALIGRFQKEPEKAKARLEKRNNKFAKYIFTKFNGLSEDVKKVVLNSIKLEDLQKNALKQREWLEKFVKRNEAKISPADRNLIANVIPGFDVLNVKLTVPTSPANTVEFDHIYEMIDDIIAARINEDLSVLSSLEERIALEEKKLNNASETYVIYFQNKSLEYLREYKEILLSVIEEYRKIRIESKKWLLEVKGVDFFIKKIIESNNVQNTLRLSILTWKGEQRTAYLKRKKEFDIKIAEDKIEELKEKLSKYEGVEDIQSNIEKIFEKEIKILKEKISKAKPKVKVDKVLVGKLNKEIEDAKAIISRNKKVLSNKSKLKEKIEERTIKTLSLVGLSEDSLNKYPDQFSGGQKQRIGIARTIITNPSFIIADEPISALDVSVQAQVVNLLKDLHKDLGLTMLFIAHDLEMVHYISTKIAVIYRGTIVEYGDADKVYKNPKHPYTKSLIAAIPSLKVLGKHLEVSDYTWESHGYNEFSHPVLKEVEPEHFVYGTDKELAKWK